MPWAWTALKPIAASSPGFFRQPCSAQLLQAKPDRDRMIRAASWPRPRAAGLDEQRDSAEPIRSTPPRASSVSSAMSNRRYLKLVLPRLATRIFMVMHIS